MSSDKKTSYVDAGMLTLIGVCLVGFVSWFVWNLVFDSLPSNISEFPSDQIGFVDLAFGSLYMFLLYSLRSFAAFLFEYYALIGVLVLCVVVLSIVLSVLVDSMDRDVAFSSSIIVVGVVSSLLHFGYTVYHDPTSAISVIDIPAIIVIGFSALLVMYTVVNVIGFVTCTVYERVVV